MTARMIQQRINLSHQINKVVSTNPEIIRRNNEQDENYDFMQR